MKNSSAFCNLNAVIIFLCFGGMAWRRTALLAILSFMGLLSAQGFTLVTSNQLVYVNVDHAPVGAGSTFAYGSKSADCGLGMSSTQPPYSGGGGGVVIGLNSSAGLQIMPFVSSAASVSSSATFFADANVTRTLRPCTDQWNIQSGGALTWTHYTPAWGMPSLNTATLIDRQRFFLPATWMVFTITNTTPRLKIFISDCR